MRKRKTLSSFIPPLYSDARTGQIVTSEPATTTGDLPCAGRDEPVPELGNLPERIPTGTRVIIGKHNLELVRAGKDDDDAPCYRLRYQINLVGNQVFDVDTLNAMGVRLEGEKV
jgi:hypothetical protein